MPDLFLAPSPGAGAVSYEEAEKSPYKYAFHNLVCWHAFHHSAFRKVEKKKSGNGAYADGRQGTFETGRFH